MNFIILRLEFSINQLTLQCEELTASFVVGLYSKDLPFRNST